MPCPSPNPRKLAAWRKRQGLSQDAAGRRFGVSQGTWANWELGERAPDRTNAPELETFTGGEIRACDWPSSRKRRRAMTIEGKRTGTDG